MAGAWLPGEARTLESLQADYARYEADGQGNRAILQMFHNNEFKVTSLCIISKCFVKQFQ